MSDSNLLNRWLCKYSWYEDYNSIYVCHTAHCVFVFNSDSSSEAFSYAEHDILPKISSLEKRSRYGGKLHSFKIEKVTRDFFEF